MEEGPNDTHQSKLACHKECKDHLSISDHLSYIWGSSAGDKTLTGSAVEGASQKCTILKFIIVLLNWILFFWQKAVFWIPVTEIWEYCANNYWVPDYWIMGGPPTIYITGVGIPKTWHGFSLTIIAFSITFSLRPFKQQFCAAARSLFSLGAHWTILPSLEKRLYMSIQG